MTFIESETIELKSSVVADLCKEVIAFANTRGGTLYIGVEDNGKVTDKSKCISCMRCVSICPVHARSLNKVTVSVVASAIKKACSVQKSNELFL